MIGMGLCASLFFSSEIETEILSALVTELKEMAIQNRATDFTVTILHSLCNYNNDGFTLYEL